MIPNELILTLLVFGIVLLAASVYLFLKSRGKKIMPEDRKPGVRYEYRELEREQEKPVNKWKPAPRTEFKIHKEWK
jgi:hypothetical protein